MSLYDTRTTHLVVGSSLGKTDKLLCGLAAGVPVVGEAYVRDSHAAGRWLEVQAYDVGREEEQGAGRSKLYLPPLGLRRMVRASGGVFRDWRVVVLLEEPVKEVYRRMLELGGGRVERWTLTHLRDLQGKTEGLQGVTHLLAQPKLLLQQEFREVVTKMCAGPVPVITKLYLGDFLTKMPAPAIQPYDVRNPEMWRLLEEEWVQESLQDLGIRWRPQPASPPLQEKPQELVQEITSPDFSAEEDDNIAEDLPDMSHSPQMKRSRRSNRGSGAAAKKTKLDPRPGGRDSPDEIQIVEETLAPRPAATLATPSPSGIARLRAKARSLLSQSSQSGQRVSGGTLDSWVVRPPAPPPAPASPDSPEQSLPPAFPPSPIRRDLAATRRQSNNTSYSTPQNHFLGLRRSGSLTSSARSLNFTPELSGLSNCSQASLATSFFTPEPASLSNCSLSTPDCEESVARLLERKEEPRARALYCHTLQVVRRARPGLEVEAEGRARTRDSHGVTGAGEQETDPLTGAMCLNMWVIAKFVDFLPANYITVVHQLEHFSPLAGRAWSRRTTASLSPDRWTRAGWLPWTWSPRCLSCHSPPHPPLQVCDHSRHLPVAALHRVLEEALHHHPDHLVRTTAYATLLHCLDCLPPSPTTARYWLQLLARTTPHQDPASGRRWEFDDQEPWRYLESVLESFSKEEEEEEESGPGLVLGLVAALLERDLVAWREDQLAGDSLALDWRPLVAHLLFPGDLSSTWGWRLERLCSVYCRRPSPVLRTLVRLAATLIAHRERVSPKLRRENSGKLELARCLAVQLPGLEEEQLGAELFQLQPSWLAALTSQLVPARRTRRGEEQEVPSLRTLISNYLDVPLKQEPARSSSHPERSWSSGSRRSTRSPPGPANG